MILLALLAALEGGDGLEARIENLRDLDRRGLRLLQLVLFGVNYSFRWTATISPYERQLLA